MPPILECGPSTFKDIYNMLIHCRILNSSSDVVESRIAEGCHDDLISICNHSDVWAVGHNHYLSSDYRLLYCRNE